MLTSCARATELENVNTNTTTIESADIVDRNDTDSAAEFREMLLKTVTEFEDGGGYYTGTKYNALFPRTTWQGMEVAYVMDGERPKIDISLARPSFCSSACYMALLKTLLDWDTKNNSQFSVNTWYNLKPYVVENSDYPRQADGVGCWGRANANGPGIAVLVKQLSAGENGYIGHRSEYRRDTNYWQDWEKVQAGDFLKIFWNGYIGADAQKSESGHMVIYLGHEESWLEDGTRDDIISYWSSNGSGTKVDGGYGIGHCRASKIYRAVCTHITDPSAFDNARNLMPDNRDEWLYALNGKHLATVEEMKAAIAGEDMTSWLFSSSSSTTTFRDVPNEAYYAEAVEWAVSQNITNGTSTTTFSPADTCTRGQVATFLWRANGCPEPTTKINPFTDVKSSSAFYKAILWAYENSITDGTTETTFSPSNPCTRAHVITFLWRSEGHPAATSTSTLANTFPNNYYTNAIAWADNKEILKDTTETFNPSMPCPRSDIVTYIYRNMT